MTAFEEFGLMPEIGQSIEEVDWMLPTDVQAEAIPLILGGGDVLMAAETGSGKTGAFCLPIIQIVYETLKEIKEGKGVRKKNTGQNWSLNQEDRRPGLAIDDSGLICENKSQQWLGCRANKALKLLKSAGKYYYEVQITSESGVVRVGWSTNLASYDLGTDRFGFGFGGTGKKSFNKQFDTYGESYTLGDIVGCFLDLDNELVAFSKNGQEYGPAYKIPDYMKSGALFPAICIKNSSIKLNFGLDLIHIPSAGGWKPVSQAPKDIVLDYIHPQGNAAANDQRSSKKPSNGPRALIIEPSRELAEQTHKVITLFKKHIKDPIIKF